MDLLLAPEARPFAIAALILIGLIGVEMILLLIGFSAVHWLDHAADGHGLPRATARRISAASSTGSTADGCRCWC